ncbi:MAG: UvrD-helicase domain-containing protein [Armatimonadetes bacterium]|nr:UvrD-helicase domain-containing protein [Armatimonadota bacterium]NIO97974.1 UvrD-helicase domain-containing protein [Armatimonadota bacterium]
MTEKIIPHWNVGLSQEQSQVASLSGRHVRVLAGPGTGKTRCLTRHANYLIQTKGVAPQDILLLTFTRAAARYMRSEVNAILAPHAQKPRVSTLHSFALQTILHHRIHTQLPQPVRVADDYEERWFIKEDLKHMLNLNRVEKAARLLNQLSADWESLDADKPDWETSFPNAGFLGAWMEHREVYGYTLRAELVYQLKRAMTSGDLEIDGPPKYLLVDEYQDLNPCDLAILRELVTSGSELYCVGDDDQSIYGFRYADPEAVRRFEEDYQPHYLAELKECWRCAPTILKYGLFVARQGRRRLEKEITSVREGEPGSVQVLHFTDQEQEAGGVASLCRWLIDDRSLPPKEILILLRSDDGKRFSSVLEDSLKAQGIPVATAANPTMPLDEPEGRRFLCLLRLLTDQDDHLAWRTILQLTKGIGSATIDILYERARNDGKGFATAVRDAIHAPGEQKNPSMRRVREVCQEVRRIVKHFSPHNISGVRSLITDLGEQKISDPEKRRVVTGLLHRVAEETGADTLEELLRGLTVALEGAEQERQQDCVSIMTMHQAKGLSADAVIIVAAEDEYIPGKATGAATDDERRLLYVSLTRGREHLYITHCRNRTGRQRHSGRKPGYGGRTLCRFLRVGPARSKAGISFVKSLTQSKEDLR